MSSSDIKSITKIFGSIRKCVDDFPLDICLEKEYKNMSKTKLKKSVLIKKDNLKYLKKLQKYDWNKI